MKLLIWDHAADGFKFISNSFTMEIKATSSVLPSRVPSRDFMCFSPENDLSD